MYCWWKVFLQIDPYNWLHNSHSRIYQMWIQCDNSTGRFSYHLSLFTGQLIWRYKGNYSSTPLTLPWHRTPRVSPWSSLGLTMRHSNTHILSFSCKICTFIVKHVHVTQTISRLSCTFPFHFSDLNDKNIINSITRHTIWLCSVL